MKQMTLKYFSVGVQVGRKGRREAEAYLSGKENQVNYFSSQNVLKRNQGDLLDFDRNLKESSG